MLKVRVLRGPDKGRTQTFYRQRVSIGDDGRNDFKLSDQMVSRFHGVLEVLQGGQYRYSDLGSLNGTLILCREHRHHLHERGTPQSVDLDGKARIAMGQTLLEVEVDSSQVSLETPPRLQRTTLIEEAPAGMAPSNVSGTRESIVRRLVDTPEHLAERLPSSSKQLQVLFRLARQLNGLNRIEEILQRVVEATFEMFPLANFFVISVEDEERPGIMVPRFTRVRDDRQTQDIMLSQSLLQEVIEKRESVLFVRDQMAPQDSRQSIVMAQITACLAAPLIGQQKLMGVMQVDSRGRSGMFGYDDLDLFTLLASSAAFAMERAELTDDIYEMFGAFVHASVAAIDARDPTTAGHSQRVADTTIMLAEEINTVDWGELGKVVLTREEITELRYAALLHDFGKIGVREEVLQKAARLMPDRFHLVLQRIETLKAVRHRQLMELLYDDLIRAGRAPTAEDLQRVDQQYLEEVTRYDGYTRLLHSLQKPRELTAQDRVMIEEMAQVTFTDAHGHACALLDDSDLANLLIVRGSLNDEERRHIESHAALSRDYLSKIPWRQEMSQIPCIAGDHHEKLDGTGYPRRLTADEIIPQVRMLTIADIYDALTANDRPYKRACSPQRAAEILREDADMGRLDADMVELFNARIIPVLAERRSLRTA